MRTHAILAALPCLLLSLSGAQAANEGTPAEMQTCKERQRDLAPKAAAFQGEARTKRLIEADLVRASREEAEGDGTECIEALDHAAKLLAGDS